MPPMGPSNQPFITPSLFTLAQSTIPSFPLGPWSSMPSATNLQATTLTPQSYQTPQATTNVLPSSQVTQAPATTIPSFQIQPPSYQTPSVPFPSFQFPQPPPPTNPLPPITNYFSMPLLGGNPPPPTTNYLASFSMQILPKWGHNPHILVKLLKSKVKFHKLPDPFPKLHNHLIPYLHKAIHLSHSQLMFLNPNLKSNICKKPRNTCNNMCHLHLSNPSSTIQLPKPCTIPTSPYLKAIHIQLHHSTHISLRVLLQWRHRNHHPLIQNWKP